MSHYSTHDVARIVGLSADKVRRYARSGVVAPDRGPGNAYRFTFQDLVLLRTAHDLETAEVPPRRVRSALRRLQSQLGSRRPMTAVRIAPEGRRVVVDDGDVRWSPESGQTYMTFAGSAVAGAIVPAERSLLSPSADVETWFEMACVLETSAPREARELYERVIEEDPDHTDALVNLGRLLHEEGLVERARDLYQRALDVAPNHATAAFNLGVALEDLGLADDARGAYHWAIEADPLLADAYYNLSRIYEESGDRSAALRYLQRYERLTRSRGPRRG